MGNIDRYIPLAFEAIKKVALTDPKDTAKTNRFIKNDDRNTSNKYIPKGYKGYISSLGANIIQAGVKTAIYFYEAKESSSEGDKRLITAAIRFMLHPDEQNTAEYDKYNLSEKLSSDAHKLQIQTLQIMDAATALKIALRTYSMK